MRFLAFTIFSFIFLQGVLGQRIKVDTITEFSNMRPRNAVFKSPNGKLYKVEFVEAPEEDAVLGPRPAAANCQDSLFSGKARKAAKTSIVTAPVELLSAVTALIKSLPSDAVTRPKLNTNSLRIASENRNVRLPKNTYLYAFKKESDNDFHVIIGDNANSTLSTFFTSEISGLPNSVDKRFIAVRDSFESQFANVCSGTYAVFKSNPIRIDIQGSVFFDVDHQPGQIGPAGFQPQTSWEIHPITKISFLK